MNKFTAVFERDRDWWLGYVEELPGADTRRAGYLRKRMRRYRQHLVNRVMLFLVLDRKVGS